MCDIHVIKYSRDNLCDIYNYSIYLYLYNILEYKLSKV